jgi:hypothetical protein
MSSGPSDHAARAGVGHDDAQLQMVQLLETSPLAVAANSEGCGTACWHLERVGHVIAQLSGDRSQPS